MCLFSFGVASAQTLDGKPSGGKQIVRVELITDATDFSEPFTVAIRFQIEPQWYVYWINPGDAGLPIEVQWELPNGWSAGKLLHPVPEKMVHGELVAYGYKREVILLSTISPAAGASKNSQQPKLRAKLDWLVCKESCIRGTATVELTKKTGEGLKRVSEVLKETLARLPVPIDRSGIAIERAELANAPAGTKVVHILLRGAQAQQVSDFFPETLENAMIDYKSISVNNGVITLMVTPNNESETIRELRGLVLLGDKGYECIIPLKQNQ